MLTGFLIVFYFISDYIKDSMTEFGDAFLRK